MKKGIVKKVILTVIVFSFVAVVIGGIQNASYKKINETNESLWKICDIPDEWGDASGDRCLVISEDMVYSNLVTNNASGKVGVGVYKEIIIFQIFTGYNNSINMDFHNGEIFVKGKEKYSMKYRGSDSGIVAIVIKGNDYQRLIEDLKNNDIQVKINDRFSFSKDDIAKYSFTIHKIDIENNII